MYGKFPDRYIYVNYYFFHFLTKERKWSAIYFGDNRYHDKFHDKESKVARFKMSKSYYSE